MAHLLIDTVKTDIAGKFLPASRHTVCLFADKRSAKPFRRLLPADWDNTASAPLRLAVLRKKAVRAAILDTARDLLAADPQARIAVVSPRGRLRRKLDALQAKHPDAQIFYSGRLGKKTRAFLAQEQAFAVIPRENGRPSENETPFENTRQPERPSENGGGTPPENDNPPAAAQTGGADGETQAADSDAAADDTETAAHSNTGDTLSPAGATHQPADLQPVLRLLRKNRPKKKAALLELLARRHGGAENAETLFAALAENGSITVDAAENIRYPHLS
ncbi:Uncharacterised protein [Kingella potus]|uniref:Uncharacterized protein n=1 Tax=Kingella potus TaxID=265175 RepID=A0A377QZD4_9NEIS|nr:hypothetical protein [Kingella potus]UOP01045.1 hypothetical protein LVJ84_01335 [Kingella potus]STR00726.1 Uncharacterised protein [Kingella potus]